MFFSLLLSSIQICNGQNWVNPLAGSSTGSGGITTAWMGTSAGTAGQGSFSIRTYGNERLRINESSVFMGLLNQGTYTPQGYNLEVYDVLNPGSIHTSVINGQQANLTLIVSTSLNAGYLNNICTQGDAIVRADKNASDLILGASKLNNGAIRFTTGAVTDRERMTITNTGQILMGFGDNPTCAMPAGGVLGVNGTIFAAGLKVKLASTGASCFPDYVFEKDYKLPSLNKVEEFITANKHLEGIPSAAEVDKEGIDVVELEKKMLEKIENLYLYVIDLKKENEILKKEINILKTTIK